MTPTERARRSDALYYDTESVARRCLCDMIANRESDLEELRAENAKLRELIDDSHMSRLLTENENESLRELVRKVLQFERAGCEGCPYASTCDVDCLYEPDCPMREDIERDMRELGVDE